MIKEVKIIWWNQKSKQKGGEIMSSGGGSDYSPGPGWTRSDDGKGTHSYTSPDGSKSSVYANDGSGRVANVNHSTGSCETFSSGSSIK
jgi:hypothetical protein